MSLLEIKNMSVYVRINKNNYTAVNNISLELNDREILGIAGESGCGKSLTAMAIAQLLPGNAFLSGIINFKGKNLPGLSKAEIQAIRGKDISVIYQDPMSALNPLIKIGKQIEEAYLVHNKDKQKEAYKRTIEVMEKTGLANPESLYHEYPHNLSGGMKQRVVIAMAIINRPKLLIADEPTTALDVTIQYQILRLIKHLTGELGSACIFISHDLGVLSQMCDNIAIMYCGEIVESGDTDSILSLPWHPYTAGLLSALPDEDKKGQRLTAIPGNVEPLTAREYGGCSFAKRCPKAEAYCAVSAQELVKHNGRLLRCSLITGGGQYARKTIA